jgi:hypothetical protein
MRENSRRLNGLSATVSGILQVLRLDKFLFGVSGTDAVVLLRLICESKVSPRKDASPAGHVIPGSCDADNHTPSIDWPNAIGVDNALTGHQVASVKMKMFR